MRTRLLLRSFLVQGSWNYETLIGTGFAFVLLPALRYIYRDDAAALRAAVLRHAELFNSHPYLVTIAAGAVARLEADGTDPHTLERFKSALRGSLGSLGDQLFWLAWRPAAALLAIALLLAGAAWWVAVAAFLVAYNALHLWLRIWGLAAGYEGGLNVGRTLRDAPLQKWTRRAVDAGAVLGGFCTVLAFADTAVGPGAALVGGLGVAAGLWLGLQVRRPLWFFLLVLWVVGVVVGITR